MAPTEVLARQHADTLGRVLSSSQVRWASLVGGMAAGERKQMLEKLAAGELDVVIGTQAILQSDVQSARLALVVIDEQHKFGVRQRATLKQAGVLDPHYLVMTATPIPRTVTMTLFGDLDVSTIADAPPRPAAGKYLPGHRRAARCWWKFCPEAARRPARYVVTPRIEDSVDSEVDSLERPMRPWRTVRWPIFGWA